MEHFSGSDSSLPSYNGASRSSGLNFISLIESREDFDTSSILNFLSGPALSWALEARHREDFVPAFKKQFLFTKDTAWFWLHHPEQAEGMTVWEYLSDWDYARSFWPTTPISQETKRWLRGLKDPGAKRYLPIDIEGRDPIRSFMNSQTDKQIKKRFNRAFTPSKVFRIRPQRLDSNVD